MKTTSPIRLGKTTKAIKELGDEIARLRALIDDDLAGIISRLDGKPIPNGASEAFADAWKIQDELMALQTLRDGVIHLRNEIDCRIQHGADSNGRLEYVKTWLDSLPYFSKEVAP